MSRNSWKRKFHLFNDSLHEVSIELCRFLSSLKVAIIELLIFMTFVYGAYKLIFALK